MPNEKANNKKEKLLCVDNLRHAEYYEMQGVFPVFSLSPGKSPLTCSAASSSRNPLPLTPT